MKKFVSKIARSGFYIILFLCISAIGISAYVMYLARDAKDDAISFNIESAMEMPFPTENKTTYDFGVQAEIPVDEGVENDVAVSAVPPREEIVTSEKEEETMKETEDEEESKTETVATVSDVKEEKTVYTMAVNGAVTMPFSGDELVKSKTMDDWRIHAGVDIKGEIGTEVLAISDGTVANVENDSMMGHTVRVEHSDGMISIYANLSDAITLKAGDAVRSGDRIGEIGQSALSECLDEPHLHLEVQKDGKNIDPLSLFPAGEE